MRNFQEHLKWITSWEDCFWTDETTIFYYTEWLMKVWNTHENLNLLFLIFFNIQYPLKVTVQCLLKFIIRYLPKSYYAVLLLKKPLQVNSASNSRWPPCNFEICFKLYNFLDWLLVLVIVNWGSISRDFPEDVSVLTAAFISLLVFAVVISMISLCPASFSHLFEDYIIGYEKRVLSCVKKMSWLKKIRKAERERQDASSLACARCGGNNP